MTFKRQLAKWVEFRQQNSYSKPGQSEMLRARQDRRRICRLCANASRSPEIRGLPRWAKTRTRLAPTMRMVWREAASRKNPTSKARHYVPMVVPV
jgi:hypothetical protein